MTAATTSSGLSLLPGEATWSSGAPSFDFGTNDTIDYGAPNVDTLSSVQGTLKLGGLTILRVWAYATDSDATIMQKLAAATNSGEKCMFMLGQTDDLTWLEHVVTETMASCPYYEFGNEPDNGGSPANGQITTYTSQWIADIPVLRALDPNASFGGPVLMWSDSNDGSQSTYSNDMQYFLATTAAAGVRADFIDYHDYPCTAGKQDTKAACLAATPTDFAWNYNEVITNEKTYYGQVIPTGVSEYNFDPGDQHLYDWCNDGTFMTQWTVDAMDEIVKLGMSFANQFDSMNWGGYGCYDMFSDAAPYGPKPQFNAMVSEVEKYKPPGPSGPPGPPSPPGPPGPIVVPPSSRGYWMVASDGGVFSFGNAPFFGSTGNINLTEPIVGMDTTPEGRGYWMVASDGGVFSFGDAPFFGSMGGTRLNSPIVGVESTLGHGYWLVASDGGLFSFGDARFFGSTGNIHLNKSIVAMDTTPDGRGYWLVASDGGVFGFGDAQFFGSTGNINLNKPIVAMASTPDGRGYWLVASDGGVFSFGDAQFFGSTGNINLNKPIVAMDSTPDGRGYRMVASDGGVFSFGNAPFSGSTGNIHLNKPIVAMVGAS